MGKLILLGVGSLALGGFFFFFWWLGKRHLTKAKQYLKRLMAEFDVEVDVNAGPKSSFFAMTWDAFDVKVEDAFIRGSYYTTSSKRRQGHFYNTSIGIYGKNPHLLACKIIPKKYKDRDQTYQSMDHPVLDQLYVFETNNLDFFKTHLTQPEVLNWLESAPITHNYWNLTAQEHIVGPPSSLIACYYSDFILKEKDLAGYITSIRLGLYFTKIFQAQSEASKEHNAS